MIPRPTSTSPTGRTRILRALPRYTSINTLLGVEQARRDDLELLAYVLMYFLRGALPWQGLKADTKKRKYDGIMEKKMTTPTDLHCLGFPSEFGIFLNYTRALRFDDKPDYSYLRKLFRDLFVREGVQYDYMFDWSVQRTAQDDPNNPSGSKTSARKKAVQEVEDHRASDRTLVTPHVSNVGLMYPSYRLRAHSCQAQQEAPGAVGRQRVARGQDAADI